MAAYITWKDGYSVGDRALDAQHREIFGAIERLYLPMQGAAPGLAAERILDGLIRSTRAHFEHEEGRQKEIAFLHAEEHKTLHLAMLQRMLDLRARLTLLPAARCWSFSGIGGSPTSKPKTASTFSIWNGCAFGTATCCAAESVSGRSPLSLWERVRVRAG